MPLETCNAGDPPSASENLVALRRELQDAGWMEVDPPEAPEENLDWASDLDMQHLIAEVMNQEDAADSHDDEALLP